MKKKTVLVSLICLILIAVIILCLKNCGRKPGAQSTADGSIAPREASLSQNEDPVVAGVELPAEPSAKDQEQSDTLSALESEPESEPEKEQSGKSSAPAQESSGESSKPDKDQSSESSVSDQAPREESSVAKPENSSKREDSKQESSKQESSKQESSKQESSKQESSQVAAETISESKTDHQGVETSKMEESAKEHTHSYGSPVWNWSGYASATATFKCTSGDDTQTLSASINNKTTTEPTESKIGMRVYTATVQFDGTTYTDTQTETLPKKEHTHTYGNPTWSWSGYSSATATFKCASGDDTKSINASVSSYVTKEPTESATGTKEYTATASFNGNTYTDSKTETLPKQTHTHSWDSGTVTKEASCSAEGVITYTCTSCGGTRTESIAKTNNHVHTEVRNKKDASCTTAGYSGDTYCKDCGTKISSGSTIAALGHREITKNAKSATCSSEGYTGDKVCSVCGVTIQQGTTIPKTDHSWDRGRTQKVATCTETGIKSYTCTVCNATKTETIPINPNNHNHVWDHDEEEPVYESCGVTRWYIYYSPYTRDDSRYWDEAYAITAEWTARNAFEDEVNAAKASYAELYNQINQNGWRLRDYGFGGTGETVTYIAGYRTIHYYKCTRCGDMITK